MLLGKPSTAPSVMRLAAAWGREIMAVAYQHEYVSGAVPVQNGLDATVLAGVVNRGSTVEHARLRIFAGHTLLFDSGLAEPQDLLSQVKAHSAWGRNEALAHIDSVCDQYWFQIFATSTNLIPSAGDGDVSSNNPIRFPYLGAGDFEHFFHFDGIGLDDVLAPIGPALGDA